MIESIEKVRKIDSKKIQENNLMFSKSVLLILKMCENYPMSAEEICDKIKEKGIFEDSLNIDRANTLLCNNKLLHCVDGNYSLIDVNCEEVKPLVKIFSEDIYAEYNKNKDTTVFEEVIEKMMLNEHFHKQYASCIDKIKHIIDNEMDSDKKRFAILSILDNNNSILAKMKMKKNRYMKKMSHIKNIAGDASLLREYVKVSDVEKKAYGEVMTPLELVNEMLDTLPKEVWKNPNLKWLDPANGVGIFPAVCVLRLMEGLKQWQPDENLRYKHILEKMIYVCELQAKNMFIFMMLMSPYKEHKLNIYCGSFLDGDFDKHMKNVWEVDKFDVIVGNPPYQKHIEGSPDKPIWHLFVIDILKIINKNGYMCLIHPSGWRNIDGVFKTVQKLIKIKTLLYLSIHNENDGMKMFNSDTRFDWYVLKNSDNVSDFQTVIRGQDNKVYKINISKMEFIPNGDFSTIEKIICKNNEENVKIISDSSYHHMRDYVSDKKDDVFIYPCVYTIPKNGVPKLKYSSINNKGHFGETKLIWSNGRIISVGSFIDNKGEYGLTQFSYAIVDVAENLESIKKVFDSKKFRDLMELCSVCDMSINRRVIATFRKDFWKEFI